VRKLIAALLLFALALGAACATSQPAGGTIVIGAVYPLSGPQGPGGLEELGGLQAALQVARDRGLLHASQVQLRVVNVQTPEGASRAVDRLIDQDHVQVIAGTYGSTLSEAASARADQRHVVYWETGAVADGVTQGRTWVFRTVATGANLGHEAVQFAGNVLSRGAPSRGVIVALDDIYGRSVADEEARTAASLGIQVVDRIDYSATQYSAAAIAAKVAADRPDYLFDVSYIDDGIAIWDAIRGTGVPLKGVLGTSSAFCTPDFGRREGQGAVGVFAADKPDATINPAVLTASGRSLLDAAKATYAEAHHGDAMSIPAVAGFVGGWALFHDVLPQLHGSVSSETVRAAALRVDVPAGDAINGGGILFSPPGTLAQGQNLRAAAVVGQWQGVMNMRVVYPSGYAVAQPMSPAG
jgi:branched-chain amino acid transport system substrate-binding protein